jgi:hypothetical protein
MHCFLRSSSSFNLYGFALMPRFSFDLFDNRDVVLDPGRMLFERRAGAKLAASEIARHRALVRPELHNGRGWIRVRDIDHNEGNRVTIGLDVRSDLPAGRTGVTLIAAE